MVTHSATRCQRTLGVLTRLDRDLAAWLSALALRDTRGHHASQRLVFDRLRAQSVDLLGKSLPSVLLPPEVTHPLCRAIEARAAAVRRVWARFRPMLDMRLDPVHGPLLAAADELVWSCMGGQMSPPPLTFLDARAAPDAFPVDRFPDRAEPELAPLLAVLNDLVLPFVRLPYDTAPWELLPLAHELGHHVQAARGWVRPFFERLRDGFGATWARQSEEVFADLYSVVALGPWALAALAEHVLDSIDNMQTSSARYPSSIQRMAVMAEGWRQLGRGKPGWDWTPLTGLPFPAGEDMSALVELALQPFADGVGLADMVSFDVTRFHPSGPIQRGWVAGLLGQAPLPLPANPDDMDARVAACAIFTAFGALPAGAEAAALDLHARALTALAACSPDGTRGGHDAPTLDFAQAFAALPVDG